MINKESATPIYLQLKDILSRELESGKYGVGDKMPSENKLAEAYKMNRLTVRRALLELEEENVIYSVHGKGRFVGQCKGSAQVAEVRPTAQIPRRTVGLCGYFDMKLDSFYGDFLTRLVQLLTDQNYQIRFLNNHQLEYMISAESADIQSILYIAPEKEDVAILQKIRQLGVAVLVVNRNIDDATISSITIDQYLSSQQLVSALLELGHRDIAVISAVQRLPYAAERIRGAVDAFKLKGLEFNQSHIFEVENARLDFSGPLKEFFSTYPEITAVFIAGETLQPCVLNVITALKKQIPDDLSVAAFGEIALSPAIPPLTHTRQPMVEMAEQAIRLLAKVDTMHVEKACLQPVFIRTESIKAL
jgi:GntR family transcriptional regulator of arabinose operon